MEKERYFMLDALRGCCLVSMILYHTAWDCVYIFGVNLPWFCTEYAYLWQQSICWTFILLAGFCAPFSKSGYKRGGIVFFWGTVIMLATCLFMPDNKVLFGILTLLGSCMLLTSLLKRFLSKLPALPGMLASFLLFILLRNVNNGYLGFEWWKPVKLPACLYRNYVTAFLGFPVAGFSSSDYFAVIPWLFLFLTGYFAHFIIMKSRAAEVLKKRTGRALIWMGQNSLFLYVLHQPVVYSVLFAASKLIKAS